jgi:hypothetical protein
MLPRIPVRTTGGIMLNGPPCGQIAIPGHEARYKNRLPVHLQYRFDKSGVYEVRYTRRRGLPGMSDSQPLFQTAWTQIEILPAQTETPHAPPDDPAEALSDYLPSILGFADDAHLHLLTEYLYSSSDTVRRYTSLALGYWPEDEINHYLTDLLRKRGPSDVIVQQAFRSPDAVDFLLPYLRSQNPVLLHGAILGVRWLLLADPPLLSAQARSGAGAALISASENALHTGDAQTANDYASVLGLVHDPRARDLLWNFVERNVLMEQSLIAITWFKNPGDLPRLASLLEAPAKGDTMQGTYSSLRAEIRLLRIRVHCSAANLTSNSPFRTRQQPHDNHRSARDHDAGDASPRWNVPYQRRARLVNDVQRESNEERSDCTQRGALDLLTPRTVHVVVESPE